MDKTQKTREVDGVSNSRVNMEWWWPSFENVPGEIPREKCPRRETYTICHLEASSGRRSARCSGGDGMLFDAKVIIGTR